MSTPALDAVQEHHEHSAHLDEGIGRYTAYVMRLKTIIAAGSRYIAYSSDIGEAFRPLTRPGVVRAAYGISWAYIFSDVGYTCYDVYQHADKTSPMLPYDLAWVAARRAVFQTLASLVLPAVTIHSVVRYSAPIFARSARKQIRAFGPTAAGLLAVPLLPLMFDHPVEYATDTAFDFIEYEIDALRQGKKGPSLSSLVSRSRTASDASKHRAAATDSTASEDAVPDLMHKLHTTVEETSSTPSLAQLAVLGLGVDLVCLPRMRHLMARHAQRLQTALPRAAAMASTRASHDDAPTVSPLLASAAAHFARRVLAPAEASHFDTAAMSHDERVRFLATRWACKEAAYKALFPHVRLRATDIGVAKDPFGRPSLALEAGRAYVDAFGRDAQRLVDSVRFHTSVSHDGEYVVATVVAEHTTPPPEPM